MSSKRRATTNMENELCLSTTGENSNHNNPSSRFLGQQFLLPEPVSVLSSSGDVPQDATDSLHQVASCKCFKTRCLKLYCECFASGFLCSGRCQCEPNCQNNHNTERNIKARNTKIMAIVKENPRAFRRSKTRPNDPPACTNPLCRENACNCHRRPIPNNRENKDREENVFIDENPSQRLTKQRKTTNDISTSRQVHGKKGTIPGLVFDSLTANFASEESNASCQASVRTGDGSKSQTGESDDEIRKLLVKRTFEEMRKILISEGSMKFIVRRRPVKGNIDPESLAHQIISNVKERLNELLQRADAAEARVRSQALAEEEQSTALASHTGSYGKIIPVGTTFKRNFDSLGEFEGVVVATPTVSSPFYKVEYEDGGSESLHHVSLVALIGSRKPATTEHTSDFELSTERLVNTAREEAITQAYQDIITGGKSG